MMKKIIFLMIAIICVSCTTVGTKFDIDDVDELVPGQTTLQEATELLGKPSTIAFMSGGTIYVWQYMRVGIGRVTNSAVAITFDDQGIMTNVRHPGVMK